VNLPFLGPIKLVVARFDVALLYVLGITSIGVYGIALAGWSSNNKYSLMGGLRSSAQMISYELALGMALIGVVLQSGTLDLYSIVEQQYGVQGLGWNIFWVQPLGFVIYMIAAIAETNRVPFDLPEAETELVAGFHTEYSAMKFALFFWPSTSICSRSRCWRRHCFSAVGMGHSSSSCRGWASSIFSAKLSGFCFSISGCGARCRAFALIS